MASHPRCNSPAHPFPYWNEVMTGFHFSAVEGILSFAPREGSYHWSNGHTFGTVAIHFTREMAPAADLKIIRG